MVSRGRRAVLGSIAVAAGIIASASSCGSGFLDGLTGGAKPEAGSDATAEAAPADARTCSLLHPPDKPSIPDSEQPGPVVFAVDAVRLDDADGADAAIAPGSGLDLDIACTCPEPETCVSPDAGVARCDRDGGADNALGRMFAYLGSIFTSEFGPDFATTRIRKGGYSALVTIGGWNREADDPKVVVAVYLSHGFQDGIDGGTAEPKFDGTDVWTVDPASVQNGDANIGIDCSESVNQCFPRYISSDAYVRGGVLVASIEVPFAISTSAGRISLDLTDMKLVARLTGKGAGVRMEGELVGRWASDRVLTALGKVPVDGVPLCEQPGFFEVAKEEICNAVDLAREASQDRTGKRCEAMSAAIHLTASPARLGRIYKGDEPAAPCVGFAPRCP